MAESGIQAARVDLLSSRGELSAWPAAVLARRSPPWSARRVWLVFALLAAIGAAFVSGALVARSPGAPGVAVHDRGAARGLTALPVAARGAVSSALGRDDPSYRARTVAGGPTLSNAGQHLVARFGGSGVEVRSGRARLGLSLVGYGYGSGLRPVAAALPRAQANRVVYARGALTEWYANGPLGLEQGFTLTAPPTHRTAGALTLALALSGNVRSSLSHGAVTFTGASGVSLGYRGLVASDATGKRLPARFELVGGRLLISVDDTGARYPLRIDPFIQQAKLTASDGAGGDQFGQSVALSGNTIAVGAPIATIDGNYNQGAVYVFVEPAGGWASATETAKLTASDGVAADGLGSAVAISGGTIFASAPNAKVGSNFGQGAVYAFVEPAGGWVTGHETAKLTASDGVFGDSLGEFSVAVSGDTVVAGAPLVAVGGNSQQGAAYVFVEPAGGWVSATQTAKLTASDGAVGDHFGWSVAVSGATIVAGAECAKIGTNSCQGAAYVFVEPAGGWASASGHETAKLIASDGATNDVLGLAVGASGNTIVVAAPFAHVGTNTSQGAAYVFVEPSGGWVSGHETAKLTASDGAAHDDLGYSVAVLGNTIVATSPNAMVGTNTSQGAAYVFVEPSGGWASGHETTKLTASDGAAGDELGNSFPDSVAISGSTIVAGAWRATVGGNNFQGAAYVFGSPSSAVPAITAISPSSGPPAGGTSVTITGTGFTGATRVAFGGVAASTFSVLSDTQITAVSPAQPAGSHYIVVTGPGGTSPTVAAAVFTYKPPAPAITSISPSSGPPAGGTTVTITGTGFTGATHVAFGAVAATSFNVVSATQITAVSPAQAAGSHYIVVTGSGGTSPTVAAAIYAYKPPAPAITGISPSSGPPAGGTSVTITGTGFTGATHVAFGGVAATSFNVVSDTQITAVSPAQPVGSHYIVVTGPGGTSATVAAAIFAYKPPAPAITAISPTSGTTAGGTSVTITGSGFTAATRIAFGAVAATSFNVVSDTQATAVSPAQAAGSHYIVVTGPGGTSPTVAAAVYTYH